MRYIAICTPERHESKPLPCDTWAEFLELCRSWIEEKRQEGSVLDWGFAPGGGYMSGYGIIEVPNHAEAWYLLKTFPGYERTCKYEVIPIIEPDDYYRIELAKEA